MDIITGVLGAIIGAVIAAYLTARYFAKGDEAAREATRQDMAARREVNLAVGTVRKRLLQELGMRKLYARGQQVPRQFMTLYDFEEVIWPVLQALEDPALNPGVAERIRSHLVEILGRHRLEFLTALAQAPQPPQTVRQMTERLLANPALEEGIAALHDALIDAVFQTRAPEPVADLLVRLEEVPRQLSP